MIATIFGVAGLVTLFLLMVMAGADENQNPQCLTGKKGTAGF